VSSYDDPRWYEQPEDIQQPEHRFPLNENDHTNYTPSNVSPDQSGPSRSSTQIVPGRSSRSNNNYRRSNNKFGQVIVVVALMLITFTGGWFGNQLYTNLQYAPSDQSRYYSSMLQQAWNIIDQNYVDRKAVNYKEMSYAAIRAMLAVLNDKGHTYFLTPEQVKAEQQQLSGNSTGIGIYIQQTPNNQGLLITATIPGAPAEKAGLKSGDIIIAVNGTNVIGKDMDTIRNMIEGPVGSKVSLTVHRPSTNQTLTFSVTRAEFQIPSVVTHYIAEDHIAHIQILGFNTGVADQLKTQLIQVKKQGATALILDLRDNPGGYLQEAIDTVSLFLASGNVLLEQDSSGNRTPDPVNGHPVDTHIPIVVLVNGNTASAAEIVSGALQDNNRAIIIGTTTLGTGTVLNEFDLPDGSAIFLGVQEWLTPKGHFIRDKGITPDITVQLNQNAFPLTPNQENQNNMTLQQILKSNDNQLIKAIQYLQSH
jgi:carboxyl-terminal processing protease